MQAKLLMLCFNSHNIDLMVDLREPMIDAASFTAFKRVHNCTVQCQTYKIPLKCRYILM